jgi:hypothetical protein
MTAWWLGIAMETESVQRENCERNLSLVCGEC